MGYRLLEGEGTDKSQDAANLRGLWCYENQGVRVVFCSWNREVFQVCVFHPGHWNWRGLEGGIGGTEMKGFQRCLQIYGK